MNYNFSEITFPSKDGVHTIYAELYTPKTRSAKGVVQLAHGLIDHVGRYKYLAEYLTGEGYIFAGNNHLGHGKSAGKPEDFGHFADKDGMDIVLCDMHTMNKYLTDTFPTLPVIMMGHSMGSFLLRQYLTMHAKGLAGAIIMGTGHQPSAILSAGQMVCKLTAGSCVYYSYLIE